MRRLLIHVEGHSEEKFVNFHLQPYLARSGVSTSARLMGKSRMRLNRGGIKSWTVVRDEILRIASQDPSVAHTLMVDYYALPKDWPGSHQSVDLPFERKAAHIQECLKNDLASQIPDRSCGFEFIPFITMHEFEGLLFSSPEALSEATLSPRVVRKLLDIRNAFPTPEMINDSPETCPSKRLTKLIPSYQKTLHGLLTVEKIGLDSIRAECPHFSEWLSKLEELGA